MSLKESSRKFIELNNFKKLTRIQNAVIDMALKNKDIVAISATGTGKTHAFLIPLLEMIDTSNNVLQAIIVSPTKELAYQIFDKAKLMMKVNPKLNIKLALGGSDANRNKENIKNNLPHILIATPGRLKDLFIEDLLRLDLIKTFIMDEADMLLDYGFLSDLDLILARINAQIMCFSATLNPSLKTLIKKYFNNPQLINIEDNASLNPKIDFKAFNIKHKEYEDVILNVLSNINPYICLIFCPNKNSCETVFNILKDNDYKALLIHGDLDNRNRKRNLKLLESKEYSYIVCSDLLARGIDIDSVSHVISLGLPSDLSFFYHRAGRVSRAGAKGECILVFNENDYPAVKKLSEEGVKFKALSYRMNHVRELKSLGIVKRKFNDLKEIAIANRLKRKKEVVKPNYKKRKKELIAKIKRKERREFIKQQIKLARKKRYKENAYVKNN